MNEIGVGIVGSGFIAGVHAEAVASLPDARVVAHCGRDPERAREFVTRHGVPQSYGDYGALLEDRTVDAVVLCIPNHLHADFTVRAAAAGKHVIVEKPLCLTLADADRMIEACRRAGVVLAYAEELCFAPKYVRAKAMTDEGAVGRVYRVNQVEKHAGPYSDWFWQASQAGGGILMDMGCHCIEWARWMLDKPQVTAVTCMLGSVLHGERTDLEDDAIIHLEFDSGQSALLESSWALHGGMDSFGHVFGTEGVIHVDLLRGQGLQVFSTQGFGEYAPAARGWSWPDYEWNWNNGYPQEDAHFFDCIRRGAEPREGGEDGRRVLEIMLACYASAAEGRRIALPYTPPDDLRAPVDLWLRARAG